MVPRVAHSSNLTFRHSSPSDADDNAELRRGRQQSDYSRRSCAKDAAGGHPSPAALFVDAFTRHRRPFPSLSFDPSSAEPAARGMCRSARTSLPVPSPCGPHASSTCTRKLRRAKCARQFWEPQLLLPIVRSFVRSFTDSFIRSPT